MQIKDEHLMKLITVIDPDRPYPEQRLLIEISTFQARAIELALGEFLKSHAGFLAQPYLKSLEDMHATLHELHQTGEKTSII